MNKKYVPKRNTITCRCQAYHFPHRKGGGKCDSCVHGKDWKGLDAWAEESLGEFCQHCYDREIEERRYNRRMAFGKRDYS